MLSLSQHSINHFFEIEIIQPKFDEVYSKYETLIGEDNPYDTSEIAKQKNNYEIFNIPDNGSYKIKKLLEEINSLPISQTEKYSNLIAHQLRTILSLILLEYWQKVNKKTLPQRKKESLQKLIQHTIANAVPEKLKQARFITKELNEMKASKIKELVDDVVHCNYSLTNKKNVDEFCSNIKHLLSLIYGR